MRLDTDLNSAAAASAFFASAWSERSMTIDPPASRPTASSTTPTDAHNRFFMDQTFSVDAACSWGRLPTCRMKRQVGNLPHEQAAGTLPADETTDDHLLVHLDLELIADRDRLLAAHARLNLQVPAQDVLRLLLTHVQPLLAQLRFGFQDRDIHCFGFGARQAFPDLHLDRLGLVAGDE